MNDNNDLNNNIAPIEPVAPIQPTEPIAQPAPVEPVAPVETVEPIEPIQPIESTQPAVTSVKDAIAQPIETTPVDNKPVESTTNKSNNKSCIVPVILILLFLGLLVGGGVGGFLLYKNNQGSSGGSSSSSSNKKDESIEPPKCNIDREHIHLSDLSDEDRKKIKISYSLGMLRTYTDSDIKSIIFNGKEYDYKEVVAALTDFNKMADMIAQEDGIVEYESWNNHYVTYLYKRKPTVDEIKYVTTYIDRSYSDQVKTTFYIVGKGDKVEEGTKYTKRNIEVRWTWPYKTKVYTDNGDYRVADPSYYGKEHSSNDYIHFSVDKVELYDVTEDFGFVLNDGRYVHMLGDTDGLGYKKWNLTKNIYVTNMGYND